MSQSESAQKNKLVYRLIVKLMAITGIVFVAYMFSAAFIADDSGQAFIYINIKDIKPGEVKYFSVNGFKVLVLRRTQLMINEIKNGIEEDYVFDSEQNSVVEMNAQFRSLEKSIFVAYGYDPFYGCDIEFKNSIFKSVCVDARYNLAGRAIGDSKAQANLIIPSYQVTDAAEIKLKLN